MYECGSAVAQSTDIPQKGASHETGNATPQTHDDNFESPTRAKVVGGPRCSDSRDRQGERGSFSSRIGWHGGRDDYAPRARGTGGPGLLPQDPRGVPMGGAPRLGLYRDQKVRVVHPRLRGPHGEIPLPTSGKLRERQAFSDALLAEALRGLPAQKYQETVVEAAQAFGVSAIAVSTHLIETTTQKLKALKERSLKDFTPFALFLDTIHRGGGRLRGCPRD